MTVPTTTRFPLHITISTLFIGLILLFGGLLSWQSYNKTSEIILSSAERVYMQAGNELQLDFRATYQPVASELRLLALSPAARAYTLDERLNNLRQFTTALGGKHSVAAIQLGYPNGDYFIVRPLTSGTARENFSAPAGAAFVVDNINSQNADERQLTRLFYTDDLTLITRNDPVATEYDPRQRPWYINATDTPSAIQPYLFYFLGKAGTTVTMKTAETGVIIASDVLLEQLSETLARHLMTSSSEVVLLTGSGHALAYHDSSKLVGRSEDGGFSIARMEELGSPVLTHLSQNLDMQPHKLDFSYNNRKWTGSIDKIARASGLDLNILMISPVDELLSQAIAIRWSSLLTTGLIMLISLPVVWLLANRIAGPMRRLAVEADAIRRFDFDAPIETRSFISEVDSLANAMRMMKQTIKQFITMINSLAGEKDFESLLERITRETMLVSQADAAVTYLVDDDEAFLQAGALHAENGQHDAGTLPSIALNDPHPLNSALNSEQPAVLTLGSDSDNKLKPLFELVDTERVTLVSVPLRNRQNEAIGVLCLLYRQTNATPQGDHTAQIAFMRALSGFAAVSIESRHLLKMQEALLDAFIKLIAGAIDAKSPYTGGHCQRVPELTKMLAHAACDSKEAPFDTYNLSDDEWDALHIASWLHDCGKVTTPEYVVDKATKLETIYDRIHEIRMRFELLKRDAQIHYWEQRSGGGDSATLEKELQSELARLDDDFAFVAECNEGGEFMAPERIERLQKIAATTWTRTLDDRIGISWEEKQRKQRAPAQPLPATEKLIDDKAEHIIERGPADYMPDDNPWGFKLDVPAHKYNRGELYNLEVARGTLSAEERYKINDHMVQTITMLEKLPYPKHLRDVPAIAGGHHETMDGKGYPKRLTRDEMSVTARMMAIADIFEALTASDRPYKKAKTLNESIRILSFMRNDNHIDPDLFRLFLTSGVWRSYGDQFLAPEQIDDVDIDQYLKSI